MPAYAYTGLTANGKTVKGVETADSVPALKGMLKRGGVYLTAVTETTARGASSEQTSGGRGEIDLSAYFDRITPKMVAQMTRLLSTLLCAGVTLPESLRALADQTESERFTGILSDITSKVNEGSSMADALSAHPSVFAPLYINMVRAGEASGSLETILIRVADFMDSQEELRGKVLSAMIYPIAMGVVGVGVVTLLMVKVVPNIIAIFEGQGAQLPISTRILIFTSDTMMNYWYLILALCALVVYLLKRWRKSPKGRAQSDRWLLTFPIIGDLARKLAIVRFARTLSTMLASGVQLLQALDIVRSLLGNVVLEKVVTEARDNIREGEGVAPALKRSGEFPPLVTHMIAVGERSGQLESMLTDLAAAYDRETAAAISRATAVLEPVMIVSMGVVVGFVIYSIMTPLMAMNNMAGM